MLAVCDNSVEVGLGGWGKALERGGGGGGGYRSAKDSFEVGWGREGVEAISGGGGGIAYGLRHRYRIGSEGRRGKMRFQRRGRKTACSLRRQWGWGGSAIVSGRRGMLTVCERNF